MKKFYIKALILLVFLSMTGTQKAYCDIDIAEFKKVKKVFQKKPKKQKETKQKSLEFKQTELDKSDFSMFEDEDSSAFGANKELETLTKDEIKQAKKKEKENNKNLKKQEKPKKEKKAGLFSKKKNKNNKEEEIFEQEEKFEQNPETITKDEFLNEEENKQYTYFNDETDLVYIKEVEIYGNNLIDANFIREQIKSKEGYQYIRSDISSDLRSLYNTGFFTQNIRALPIRIDDNNVKLRIILEENPPVSGFGIIGNNSIPNSEIMQILDKYKNLPQNILSINNAISEVQELYATKGYILARVEKVADDPDGYINFQIDEGVIGDIIVDGNNKTKDFIVKRNIFLQPGCVYNENTMRSDILRLMGTQAFKDVQRELKRDEETGLYNVFVALEEQRTGKISLGVGIDSVSGFFGSVGFGENNFRGLGQKLNLNLLAGTGILMNDSSVVSKANLQGEISFLEPMFKRENQSLGIRGFGRYYGSYQVPMAIEKRFGAEATISRKFITYKNLSGSIGFGAESVTLDEGDAGRMMAKYASAGVPWSERDKELDGGFFIKITPALTYDTRDSAINARRGVLARIALEENLGISGETFGKLHGMIRKFTPVGKKSSIVLTGRAGGAIHGDMPDFAGFSLGGPYNIRGFNISEVGVGDGFMMASAEYRVPIPFIDRLTSNTFLNNLRLAAFVDAGSVFGKTIGTKVYDKPGYAIAAGFGLRVFIPGIGPINLDYGIPLTDTKGTNRSSGFFTFGMGEMY